MSPTPLPYRRRHAAPSHARRQQTQRLPHIFLDPLPGQFAVIEEILRTFSADVIVADMMFLGAFPPHAKPQAVDVTLPNDRFQAH